MKECFLVFTYEKDGKPYIPVMFHVLLFASEMKKKGDLVKIVFEGEGVKWLNELFNPEHPLKSHVEGLKDTFVACEACSSMFSVLEKIKGKVELENRLHGHVSLKNYLDSGYTVIEF
ncbi:conserved hypothetical protein [Methanococcus vannielii SB]|jgi:hypothetical protein|uniref:DsrE family protein n=1 Tax=Methanococcus vannielii (strain ATCC 35089 / DSM 1224 / JCM 13029 / OCM 148 / SB) TaxID=406327 RepID=A6UPG6_METVS|nr:DsrE family protein [Methanococcus vannielii]ABR54388.1 conserved hypothetical protein [Methanococcus vannielii SB]